VVPGNPIVRGHRSGSQEMDDEEPKKIRHPDSSGCRLSGGCG
jgi:hypothetical protein